MCTPQQSAKNFPEYEMNDNTDHIAYLIQDKGRCKT